MANIGSLVVSLQARTESLEKQLNRANGLIKKLQKETKGIGTASQRAERQSVRAFTRMSAGARGMTTRIVVASRAMKAFAVAAAGFLAVGVVRRTIAAADAIGKFADRIGVGVEELQALQFVASQSGVALNNFNTGLQRFTRRAAEAAQGTGEAKDTFRQLGIQLTDSSGRLRGTTDLLGDVADAFGRLPTQADRVRAAFKLFDTEGVAFVNILRLGSKGIDDLIGKAQRLGLVLTENLVRRAEEANDQLDIIERTISTRVSAAILNLSPQIIDFGNSFARIVERITNANAVIDGLTGREEALADFFRGVTQVAGLTLGVLTSIVKALGDIAALATRKILGKVKAPDLVGPNPNLPPLPGDKKGGGVISGGDVGARTEREIQAAERAAKRIQQIRNKLARQEVRQEAARQKKILDEIERLQADAQERAEQRLQSFLVRNKERNRQVQASFERVSAIVTPYFDALSSAVSNAAIGVAQGTQTISQAIRNMVQSIVASLLSAAVNQAFAQLQRLAINAFVGAASSGAGATTTPGVAPVGATGAVGRGVPASNNVTVINVANQEQAQRLAALEQAQGRSVTIQGLSHQVRTEGNGNALVQSLRETMRR